MGHVCGENVACTLCEGRQLYSASYEMSLKVRVKVLLVRNPTDWVLARARFFMTEEFEGAVGHISDHNVTAEQFLNMMIFGIHKKVPNMEEIYVHNAVAWLHTDTIVLKFEDLLHAVKNLDEPEAEVFSRKPLDARGSDLPYDWLARVRIVSGQNAGGPA